MVTAEWKHKLSDNLIWYNIVAATFNVTDAHYDLGAGDGRLPPIATTLRCIRWRAPHCWTGTTLVGVSSGLQWRF
jgi:hypothetical protein